MKKLAGVIALVVMAAACSSVTPVAIRAGDVCFRCKRPIVDNRVAAEIIGADRLAYTYRTSGCLAKYLAEHPEDTGNVFVTDYPSGRLVRAEGAIFVPTVDRDNGERDYLAFSMKVAADAAAAERKSTAVPWTKVLETARQSLNGN